MQRQNLRKPLKWHITLGTKQIYSEVSCFDCNELASNVNIGIGTAVRNRLSMEQAET